ncbi:Zinc finger protein Xfin [Frankliniella fusca]|uniref:Zinc finger protein 865 n=1 Tax=Frankliniella fusca TaxID=407009 RepID=A0AAE1LWN0_9NEOP|nr:Zinc finger protein Xfin [Frankliniella fusca]
MHQHQSTMCKGNEKSFIEDFERDAGANSNFRPLQCSQCPARFKSYSLLRRHLIRSHEEVLMHGCTDCLQMFTSLFELQEHRRTAHINGCGDLLKKSFDCTECPETFERRSDWLRHFRTHRGSRPYKCTECGKTFLESGDLRSHLIDHSKEMCDSSSDNSNDSCYSMSDEVDDDSANGFFDDSLRSGSPLKTLEELSDQISIDLPEEANDEIDAFSDFTDNFPDDLSDGGFSELSVTLRHLYQRKNARPHKCPMCRLRFRQINHLLTHLDTHLPNRPYKCSECNQSFKRQEHLRRHAVTHTQREMPFKCTQCSESFISANFLGRHMRIHGGSNPYACHLCEFRFKSPSSLEKHLKVHDPSKKYFKTPGEGPRRRLFKCTVCLLKFQKRKALMQHLLGHLDR